MVTWEDVRAAHASDPHLVELVSLFYLYQTLTAPMMSGKMFQIIAA